MEKLYIFDQLSDFHQIKKALILLAFSFFISVQVSAQSVTISETMLTTFESGMALQYTVVLTTSPDPGETVTVTPFSIDVSEGNVSGALIFTATDWNVPQPVTLTPADDGVADGDVMFSIDHTVNTSGGSYAGVTAASISVTNYDNEVANIFIDPSSAIVVDEAGLTTQIVNIYASMNPPEDVVVTFTNNSPTEVTLSTTMVTLLSGGTAPQSLTITGVLDNIVEGTQPFSITTSASSDDAIYDSIDPVDIAGKVTDSSVVAPIPTLGQWGLIILSLLLLTLSLVALSNRKMLLARARIAFSPRGIR